eukprot:7765202-Ditylum_brightwellii.AAC.1
MAKGCRVISPSNNLTVPAYTDMFVDDKTMLHNDNEINIPPQNLMRIVQYNAELWGETTMDIRRYVRINEEYTLSCHMEI